MEVAVGIETMKLTLGFGCAMTEPVVVVVFESEWVVGGCLKLSGFGRGGKSK
jgi:hypothetical protein